FCVNLPAGRAAASGAMLAELLYRLITAGFYGAITQVFSDVEPEWAASLAVALFVPAVSHTIELTIHRARGTPRLASSLIASIAFTIISTLFNRYAMRRGALVVGKDAAPVADDLRRMPRLIAGFLGFAPLAKQEN